MNGRLDTTWGTKEVTVSLRGSVIAQEESLWELSEVREGNEEKGDT